MQKLNNNEQELWARVYAAEYDRLQARAVVCFEPEPDSRHPSRKQSWQCGSALDGNDCERQATQRADQAVELLRERKIE